jgi:hypothetical protein
MHSLPFPHPPFQKCIASASPPTHPTSSKANFKCKFQGRQCHHQQSRHVEKLVRSEISIYLSSTHPLKLWRTKHALINNLQKTCIQAWSIHTRKTRSHKKTTENKTLGPIPSTCASQWQKLSNIEHKSERSKLLSQVEHRVLTVTCTTFQLYYDQFSHITIFFITCTTTTSPHRYFSITNDSDLTMLYYPERKISNIY